MKTIYRDLFVTVERCTCGGYPHYVVLNDGNFVRHIHADSDEQAIEKYKENPGV